MSIESLTFGALTALFSGRVYPDVAPEGALLPRAVYQEIGGRPLAYEESSEPDRENSRVQVVVWAATRTQATVLSKQVKTALLGVADLQATPLGGRTSTYEPDTKLYGARQDFSVWAPR